MPPKPADMASSPKKGPGHFLVRNTGEVVPLIPVDELPIGMEIIGVPRSLDLTATVGMLNLGLVRSTGHVYESTKKDAAKKDEGVATKPQEAKTETGNTKPETVRTTTTTKVATASPASNPSPSSTAASSSGSQFPTTNTAQVSRPRAPASSTQTCKHWAAHGICKWGQQCRYRHIMPMTHHGLREAGLSDWPTWYRAMNPGYFHDPVSPQLSGMSVSMHGGGHVSHRGRGNFHGCSGGGGCCDPYARMGSGQVVRYDGHGERRNHNPYSTKPASSTRRFVSAAENRRREEAGEEVLERLRMHALAGEVAEKEKEKEKEKGRTQEMVRKAKEKKVASGLIERAAGRNTRAWEEESGSDGESDGDVDEGKGSVAVKVEAGREKAKLVDV